MTDRSIAATRSALSARVAAAICDSATPGAVSVSDWEALARDVFAFQCWAIPAYGKWCAARDADPRQIRGLTEIPAVPTSAFKEIRLFAGDDADIAHTFRTSGTTGAARGTAHFSREGLALMDVAIEVRARAMLFADGARTRIVALAPSPAADPDRIMAYGVAQLIERFGVDGSGFFVGAAGLDVDRVLAAFAAAQADGVAITLAGGTSALVAVLEATERRGSRFHLPAASRVMHAGGAKRDARPVDAGALRVRVADLLSIPASRCINLLGMTELASQLYDGILADHVAGEVRGGDGKVPAPWARTWVVDPTSGSPTAPGEIGVLRHLDLANVERPLCVQTDDLGVAFASGRFEILGRASGAEARGCALDLDEWRDAASAP